MTRDEFVEACSGKTEEELKSIAALIRKQSESRIPPEVQREFRRLDDVTEVKEQYVNTSFGGTHLHLVRRNDSIDWVLPVVVNVHGGGWCLAHTERDIYFSRRMANRLNALVIDVDYVLAPEHPYPEALEEMQALLEKLPEFLREWKGDPERVILCGQSAGGNILGAVMERKHDYEGLKILRQILCYLPADNYKNRFGSSELDQRAEFTEYYGFFYNRRFEDRRNFDVSLVFSTKVEMKDLPKTDIVTAGLDDLMPEGKKYAELLRESGVDVSYRCFEKSRHGFLVNLYDEWKEGEDYLVRLMRSVLE